MKLNPLSWSLPDEGDLIALFGNARLVKRLNGKFELLGGTDADRAEIARLLPAGFAHGDRYSDAQLAAVERYC